MYIVETLTVKNVGLLEEFLKEKEQSWDSSNGYKITVSHWKELL